MRFLPLTCRQPWWDAWLALLLLVSGTLFLSALHQGWWKFAGLMAIGIFLILYGSFIEPKRIIVNKKNVRLKDFPTLRIVVASDFHIGPYVGTVFLKRAVERMNAQNPDIILLPGDFLDDTDSPLHDLEPLRGLRARHGVYAVTGNHDAGNYRLSRNKPYLTQDRTEELRVFLEGMGIVFLRNAQRMLTVEGKTFAIAGTDDPWMESCDLHAALHGIPADVPVILVAHSPDILLQPAVHRAQLIVSGHTHGGQIRLPFIGSLAPIPDHLGRAYDRGLFRISPHTQLFITHGMGETGVRARLWCPPEVAVLDVTQ